MASENVKTVLMAALTAPQMSEQLKVVKQKIHGKPAAGSPVSFDHLLSLPMQHLTRMALLLSRILHEGKKADVEEETLQGFEQAIQDMNDVTKYVDTFYTDAQYINKMEENFKRVYNVPDWPGCDYRFNCGILVLTSKFDLRLLSEAEKRYSRGAIHQFVRIILNSDS
jgi:hypothetical protein